MGKRRHNGDGVLRQQPLTRKPATTRQTRRRHPSPKSVVLRAEIRFTSTHAEIGSVPREIRFEKLSGAAIHLRPPRGTAGVHERGLESIRLPRGAQWSQ